MTARGRFIGARTEAELQEAAVKAFVTGLLLSRDSERAEAAVLESIESMTLCDAPSELIRRAAEAAIEPEESPGEPEPASSSLPVELQRLLDLPRSPRQCFVLRVLAGLSSEACAGLLHSEAHKIDENACAAMIELAVTRNKKVASHS